MACYFDVLRAVAPDAPVNPALELWISGEEAAEARARLVGAWGEDVPRTHLVGVQPGASQPGKRWGTRAYAEVADALVRDNPGVFLALIGGPDEQDAAEEMLRQCCPETRARAVSFAGRCSLRGSLALVSELGLFVGNDTAIMHSAVALGVPTVALFGPTNPRKWGNYGPCQRVLESPGWADGVIRSGRSPGGGAKFADTDFRDTDASCRAICCSGGRKSGIIRLAMTQHTPKRALFIRFGGMGDILLATPSLRAVARTFPGIEIDFVVGGGMAASLNGHPLVRRVLTFDKRGVDSRLDHFLPFLFKLSRERYDLVVNLHPSAKSYLMAWASGAQTKLTFVKDMAVRPDTGRVTHAVDDFYKELLPLGVGPLTDRSLDFVVPGAARESAARVLADAGIRPSDKLLLINPAASRPLNRWPLERFRKVAAFWAAQPGVAVAVTGAPASFKTVMDGLDEVSLAREVASGDVRIHNLAGRLSVKEFGAVLERADCLLTCDTGPMHIGAALNTPLVVLSGAADPDRTGPLTANSTVLIDRALPCVPCRDRICSRGDVKCMDNLSTEAVIEAVAARAGIAGKKPLCPSRPRLTRFLRPNTLPKSRPGGKPRVSGWCLPTVSLTCFMSGTPAIWPKGGRWATL